MKTDELLARCQFPPPGTAVTCGVSGGADSSALLVLACAAGCIVTAVHVDHGLREGSAGEADRVRDLAGTHGASFRSVTALVEPGSNLEARARVARHAALGRDALLGHTMDDQAETMLLALLRGAALDGLAGMRPDRRPLLTLRRHETHELCRSLGLDVLDDPSNADLAFRRNRVRHEVLPLLGEVAQRDLVPVLARQATLLRQAADHLGEQAAAVDPTDARAAREVPEAVLRVALRDWLRSASSEGHPPDAASIERVLKVVRGEHVATQVAGGARVSRTSGNLQLTAQSPDRVTEHSPRRA